MHTQNASYTQRAISLQDVLLGIKKSGRKNAISRATERRGTSIAERNVADNPSAPATQDEFDMSWTTFLWRLF